jgi:hypothetical protein
MSHRRDENWRRRGCWKIFNKKLCGGKILRGDQRIFFYIVKFYKSLKNFTFKKTKFLFKKYFPFSKKYQK